MSGTADHNDRGERKDEAGDRLTSLYGLTPKVEGAIVAAVDSHLESRARALVAPLHPADQAELIERLPTRKAEVLVRMLGNDLDARVLSYLDEATCKEILDIIGVVVLARQLPDLPMDDVIKIVKELEQDEIDDVLEALPCEERVLVEEGCHF